VGELPELGALVARLDAELDVKSSLERLGAAVVVSGELHELGDLVVDHYVQAARADGRSWSQIGEALGVSKQAAQQRFPPAPATAARWPGLSVAASVAMQGAVEHARALRHRYLGTEHVLFALACDDGLAGSTLTRLGVSADAVSEQIAAIIGVGHSAESATLGITPRTKRVLEAARTEARRLGHRCADTEHLLLATAEHEGVAEQILRALGVEPRDVREELARLLDGEAPEVATKLRAARRHGRWRSRT
jgi:hypothetical protein